MIEYLYLYKHLLFQLNNKKDCILHYLINYIHLNKNYKSNKFICKDFNWIIYTNYYHDLNFIKNYIQLMDLIQEWEKQAN